MRRYLIALIFALADLRATPAQADTLFVSEEDSGEIDKITPGVFTPFVTTLNRPLGLAFDASGNLFEADAGSGRIYKITPGGVVTPFATGLNHAGR